jgi:hypothetical protein
MADCLNYKQLESSCGLKIQILDGGKHNTGDGADFSNASITIDGLKLFGSIELHVNCQDWYSHHHETDPKYNRVILHVVLSNQNVTPVKRQDGTSIPTVCLYQSIPKNFASLIRELGYQESIACSGVIKSISPEVFTHQLNTASELYFQHKVKEQLVYFDTGLPPSEAWLKMFVLAWADGLGIPKNRANMVELALFALDQPPTASVEQLNQNLLEYAGLVGKAKNSGTMQRSHWDYSGSRPGNRPELRIKHLSVFIYNLKNTSFRSILLANPEELLKNFSRSCFGGKQRSNILKLTVILPSLYLLGQLFHRKQLQAFATSTWLNSTMPVPESILKPYLQAGVNRNLIENNPGIVYQSRQFCKKKQCEECFVFKNALGG